MKTKLIFNLIIVILSLASCNTHSTPVLNSINPFIIEEINDLRNGLAEYHGNYKAEHTLCWNKPMIVLPAKWYNIGDTIQIKCR